MERRGAENLYALLHQDQPYHNGDFTSWAKEPSPEHPYRYDDGARIWVSREDLSPDDNFLG